jgi:hypothetical protein
MRTFQCTCGERVFFENTRCLACQRELGYLPDRQTMSGLEPLPDGVFETPFGRYKKCANYAEPGLCNWLVPEREANELCEACRLNRVIPDLEQPRQRALWAEVERAKRLLLYGLARLGLPVVSKQLDPERGLAFDIKADAGNEHVITGHCSGLITLNLAEADAVSRERARVSMQERYRTLLGHFRHEIGHHYFDRFVQRGGKLAEFRAVFGDETRDYAAALRGHYQSPPGAVDADAFISAYASCHPLEDWAETFAHYLHMTDTLETAESFGLARTLPTRRSLPGVSRFDVLLAEWSELTIAMNALNRSMGLPDAYPFTIGDTVRSKLKLVHVLVHEQPAQAAA